MNAKLEVLGICGYSSKVPIAHKGTCGWLNTSAFRVQIMWVLQLEQKKGHREQLPGSVGSAGAAVGQYAG